MQNGLGLLRNTASSSATHVSVFSPPDSKRDAASFLAGRLGDDFDAAFQHVVGFVDDDVSLAAAEQSAEQLLKMAANRFERRQKQLPAVDVDSLNDPLERRLWPRPGRDIGRKVCRTVLPIARVRRGLPD